LSLHKQPFITAQSQVIAAHFVYRITAQYFMPCCILYADDMLLLSPTITGLQNMLDKCSELAKLLQLEFNVEKSHCIAFGSMSN